MDQKQNDDAAAVRLNRFLADAGCGSRRSAEDLIRQGRVVIGGEVVLELGTKVHPDRDEVRVDGQILRVRAAKQVYAFHKPIAVVCTLKGQGGQATLLPYKRQADLPEPVMPIGRLDADSTGLLLWTDDGFLNQQLCRPGSGIWKEYAVNLARPLTPGEADIFSGGSLLLDGRPCLPCRIEPLAPGGCAWLVYLHEGRKRQIRRMFRAMGNRVLSLHRRAFGTVRLGKLEPGGFRRLTDQEVDALRHLNRETVPGKRKV